MPRRESGSQNLGAAPNSPGLGMLYKYCLQKHRALMKLERYELDSSS